MSRRRPHEDRPHQVYVLRNAQGIALYVGVTSNLKARLSAHRRDKPWWPDVDHTMSTCSAPLSWEDALTLEEHSIRTLKPLHNRRRANGSLYVRLGVRDAMVADRERARQRTEARKQRADYRPRAKQDPWPDQERPAAECPDPAEEAHAVEVLDQILSRRPA